MSNYLIYLLVILFGILVILFVAVTLRYQQEIKAVHKRIESLGSQVIETDSGPIEYARVGKGYPLLIVHGAMGGFDQGLRLAHSFDLSKYQVISISRFGYLRSPLPAKANLDLQADAFAGLLDALEIRQTAVFTASAGSTSAIRFAARHPEHVSALILFSPDAPGKNQIAMPPKFVFDNVLRNDFIYWALITFFGKSMRTAYGLVPRGYTLTPEYEALVKNVQQGDLPASRRMDGMIFESYTSVPEFNASVSPTSPYPLHKIKIPVLIIHAMDDSIVSPENVRKLAEQMPVTRSFVAPDGGHLLLGYNEEVKAEISQFLRSNVPELKMIDKATDVV